MKSVWQIFKIAVSSIPLIFVTPAIAGIYRCEQAGGAVKFQDTPCQPQAGETSFVPLSYTKTNPGIIKAQEKECSTQNKKRIIKDRQKAKHEKKLAKQFEKNQLKSEKQILRCQRIQKKIDHLESQLRQGRKIKRYNRIQEQLEHAQLMKKHHCLHE